MMLRQWLSGCIGFVGMFFLIVDGRTALIGAKEGIELCIQTLIPSLFPFFLFSSMLTNSFVGQPLPILRPLGKLFSMPVGMESLLITSFLGGYPVGAQNVASAYAHGKIGKKDAEKMLSFCSNAGPSFLFGIVSFAFPDKRAAWILWGIHIFTAWMVKKLLFHPEFNGRIINNNISSGNTVFLAVKTMASVCGWVVLFRVIVHFLKRWFLWRINASWQIVVTGILELSNGCCELAEIPDPRLRFVICSGILALGGLCVALQTASVVQGLSMKYYCIGKLLHAVLSIIISICIVYNVSYLIVILFCAIAIFPIKQKIPVEIPGKL